MEANQPFQQDNLIITLRCTVCGSTQIRQRTCANQLFLRDDWNPRSESSCPHAHLGLSAGGGWFSTYKLLIYPTSLAGPVSIGAFSVFRRRLLVISFVSVFRFRLGLCPFTQAGSCSPLLKRSLLHSLASRQGGVGRCPFPGGVVHDVHDCFVFRRPPQQQK